MAKAKDKDEVVEIEEDSDEGLEEEIEEAEVGDESGIFDEDLILEEEDSEGVSDFFIGDTILSSGNAEVGWSKEDLEEVVRNERIEKDWQDSEEFVGGDFYKNIDNDGDFYGASNNRDGFYETERGGDLYRGESGGDVYNTGEGVYAAGKKEDGSYVIDNRDMKSYEEVVDNRRKGRSVLEMAGFEDKEKQKDRDTHGLMDYTAKKAA